jgi:hypothetical protein
MRTALARRAILAAVVVAHAGLATPADTRAQAAGPVQAPSPAPAAPTTPSPARPPAAVRVGKWATLVLAAGFTALGAATHDRADRRYQSLLDYCRLHGPCPLLADGRYGNAGAESIYRGVCSDDRAARAWLAGGQVALVGSAVLFILELNRKRGPENIPFAPYLATGRFGALVGVQVR